MNDTAFSNVKYWSNRLNEITEDAVPLLTKMHDAVDSLTYEESYKLRTILQEYASVSRVFSEQVQQEIQIQNAKKPLFKRLFNK